MQQTSYRNERINELLKREIVLLVRKRIKDPRLQDVVITDVIASRDLSIAKVFFSTKAGDDKEVNAILNKAAGFFRSQLSKIINLRHTPVLSFIYDKTPNTGARIEDILKNL